ncbi:oligopeptide:H+ symporter [Bifidobacterium sp. ESL0732]|uniref:peptide MFS transporter n=1 Tax=Bifidobacterium sp. ESL0732 TaxID=2983222 RepID=UPI0023F82561|nr:oligopeptide:H+ symporter [Bifidobacterium sp. ESL0732]WEV64008.1 oligopeptide:H+ symporter [Bifidobacterium sp. ESL0732]
MVQPSSDEVQPETEASEQNTQIIEKIHGDHKFLGHPRGTGSACALQFGTSVGNTAISSILIYYMYAKTPTGLGMSQTDAAQIMSLYGTTLVLCGVVGGFVADRILGPRTSVRLARLLQVIAYSLLAFPFLGIPGCMASLVLLSIAPMFVGRSLDALIGMQYAEGDNRRSAAYTMTYVFTNIAGIFTPTIVGTMAQKIGYWSAFAFGALIALLAWIFYVVTEKKFFGPLGVKPADPMKPAVRKKALGIMLLILVAAVAIMAALFITKTVTISGFSNAVSTVAIFIPIVYFIYIVRSHKVTKDESRHVMYILPLALCNIVAGWVWNQSITIISIYTEQSVNRNIFGFEITPAAFYTWGSICAVLFGTLFASLWTKLGTHQPSTAAKMGIGAVAWGLGPLLMILPFLLYPAGTKVSPFWVIAFWILVMIGEANTQPAGYTAAADVAPKAFQAQMMTVWNLSAGIGAALNTISINFYHKGGEAQYFLLIGGVTLVIGLITVIFSKKFAKGMGVLDAK